MKEKTNVREALVPLLILFASFIGVTLCSMIFMAKDNNYDNMINQYFNISKELYGKLIYLHISKGALVNGMNLCSLAFLFGNFMLVWEISSAKEKREEKGFWPQPVFICSCRQLSIIRYSSAYSILGKWDFCRIPGSSGKFTVDFIMLL